MSSVVAKAREGLAEAFYNSTKHFDKQMETLGIKVELDSGRNIRLKIIANTLSFVKNPNYGVEAKIEYLDDMITMNMPWGEGGDNQFFAMLYTAWQLLLIDWELVLSERRRYNTTVIRAEFEEALPQYDMEGDVEKVRALLLDEKVKMPKDFDPKTAWALYFEYNDPNSKKFKQGLKFTPTEMLYEPAILDEGEEDIYNSEEELHQLIENFGKVEILRRGLIVLMYTFRSKHMTPNQPIVIRGMMNEEGRAPQFEDSGVKLTQAADEAAKRRRGGG